MNAFDADTLARQLAALGRDLQDEVGILGRLEEEAVDAEGAFRKLEAEYDDTYDRAFLDFDGGVEVKKAQARVKCFPERLVKQDAELQWGRAKARVRTQQANLQAIHRRVEIGRSLLSREKAMISLAGTGEV